MGTPIQDRFGSRLIGWLSALLIVAGIIFEELTPVHFTGSPFFAAAPMVAAPFFSFAATALAGAAGIASIVGLHLFAGPVVSAAEWIGDLFTVLTVAVLALFLNRLIRRGRERLASARVIAEAAQRAVLPDPPERIGGLDVAARYEAAHAEASIGGDLFAVQETPYGVRLLVGDVRGKGLGAVEAVAVLIGAFREAAEREADLRDVALRLEEAIRRNLRRLRGAERVEGFSTAVVAEVVPAAGDRRALRLLNRGHPAPLLLDAEGGVRAAEPSRAAPPLGMGDLAGGPDRVDEFAFPDGTTLLLFTDGVTEARDAQGAFYDPELRLRGRRFSGPDALLDALVADVERHTAGRGTDDMALLAVGRPVLDPEAATRQAHVGDGG